MEWISVKDKLPEDGKYVMILIKGNIEVARIEMGISMEQRKKMKLGELPDPEPFESFPWAPNIRIKRSDMYARSDEFGNNLVPYKWISRTGPMEWFGQNVTHWMPLPEPPKEE